MSLRRYGSAPGCGGAGALGSDEGRMTKDESTYHVHVCSVSMAGDGEQTTRETPAREGAGDGVSPSACGADSQ